MQQATVNILADMGATATALDTPGIVQATKSTDTSAPTAVITSPAAGSIAQGTTVTVTGTATDTGGGVSPGSRSRSTVEQPGIRRRVGASFTYTGVVDRYWLRRQGPGDRRLRQYSVSGRHRTCHFGLPVQHLWVPTFQRLRQPAIRARSRSVRISRAPQTASSPACGSTRGPETPAPIPAPCTGVTAQCCQPSHLPTRLRPGWQTASFPSAVPISAGTTYVAAYTAPNGRYSADSSVLRLHGKNF